MNRKDKTFSKSFHNPFISQSCVHHQPCKEDFPILHDCYRGVPKLEEEFRNYWMSLKDTEDKDAHEQEHGSIPGGEDRQEEDRNGGSGVDSSVEKERTKDIDGGLEQGQIGFVGMLTRGMNLGLSGLFPNLCHLFCASRA